MKLDAPWLKFYGDLPHTLEYPDCSMVDLVIKTAGEYPDYTAYGFLGYKQSYSGFIDEIHMCARGLKSIGIGQGDKVTINMPNTPQAVIMVYALNLIGAVANMTHPQAAEEELVGFINDSQSLAVLTLDQFALKIEGILPRTNVKTLILTSVEEGMRDIKKQLDELAEGAEERSSHLGYKILRFCDLMRLGQGFKGDYAAKTSGNAIAFILYSGGTSGTSKGILLTNLNVNAISMQAGVFSACMYPGHKMLAISPLFHGYGFAVGIHLCFISGLASILVPKFSVESYAQLLREVKPHVISGVPTLFEALLRLRDIDDLDMSQLEGIFSGGDTLTVELKRRVDKFLKEHGADVQIREGYGLTETVTASCLTPRDFHKEGSIGIPFPDMFYKIVRVGTQETLPYGQDGEIVMTGPTLMKGYNNNPEETAQTLQIHADGHVWVHTGDLGMMDEDGFLYFRQRIKRMIISSGYNIYPSQIENIIGMHESVLTSCVIGVPDDYKGQRIKAFVVLNNNIEPTDKIKASIIELCRKNIAKYSMPHEFVYRKNLPLTSVGKIDFKELERDE